MITSGLKTEPKQDDLALKGVAAGAADAVASSVSVVDEKPSSGPSWWADKENVPDRFTDATSVASINSKSDLINFGIGEIFGGLAQIGYTVWDDWRKSNYGSAGSGAGSSSSSSSGSSGGGGGGGGGGGSGYR